MRSMHPFILIFPRSQALRLLDGRGLAQLMRELGKCGLAHRALQLFELVRRWG